jgi:hypothetical protein
MKSSRFLRRAWAWAIALLTLSIKMLAFGFGLEPMIHLTKDTKGANKKNNQLLAPFENCMAD